MTTFLPKNQNALKISAALFPQNRKGKHSDIRYNKHHQCEEDLKKTIVPLTQQHYLFHCTQHISLYPLAPEQGAQF